MMAEPDESRILGGRYQIISRLGGGGFGQTYLAFDNHLPGLPKCVVKQLKPQLTDVLSLQTAERLFETEAKVLYSLGNYDRIPNLLAHFKEGQEFYLVQELIDGRNVSQEMPSGVQLPEAQVILLVKGVLEVLVYLHQHNIIHRDIKPSNLIRRERDGKLVLIDFGAVKQLGVVQLASGHTTRTIAIGSPGYMPPEQLAGKPRFCSDLYAVGMLGIQALTGLHPKELPDDSQTFETVWRDRASVSSELADILDRMVRYDFRQRYQTAEDVLRALSDLAPGVVLPPALFTCNGEDCDNQTIAPLSAISPYSDRGIDYTHLHNLLAAGAWKSANEETCLLMRQACNRDRGEPLHTADLRTFPCRDLHTLDQLWLRYSEEKFGFSVQQRIWQAVGGKLDGNVDTWDHLVKSRSGVRVNSPWERFGTRVGWRDRSGWITPENATFSLNASEGHLPLIYDDLAGVGGRAAALFSRLAACRV